MSHLPQRPRRIKFQRTLHRWLDPLLSQANQWLARRKLAALTTLSDGTYGFVPHTVPYVAQFASPDLIAAYIHEHLHGSHDPQWANFGAPDADTYTFWAHRACAIACIKMAIDTFGNVPSQSLWALTQTGIQYGGYVTHDAAGRFIDQGWLYPALVRLATENGLQVWGAAYTSVHGICRAVLDGWLVAAAVTPELGEDAHGPHGRLRRYDGHFVLVYGFDWCAGQCTALHVHNPSGRTAELQANACIPRRRFQAAYAHRFIAFRAR